MTHVLDVDLREPCDLVLRLVEQDGTVVEFRVSDAAGGGGNASAFLTQLAAEAREKSARRVRYDHMDFVRATATADVDEARP